MKLSDYIARYLASLGVRQVYAISGGASIHLIHSLADTPGIDFVCPQHEQAAAMAADASARVTGEIGVAVGTSGPGATNLLTGVACAYYDSIPMLCITGQTASFRLRGDSGVRQLGFQETDVLGIFGPVTKYCVQVTDPTQIRYELERATYNAFAGRRGPVLLDIPDDVFRAEIDEASLEGFTPPMGAASPPPPANDIAACVEMFRRAERPVLIVGAGVRSAGAEQQAKALLGVLGCPVAPTWAMKDVFPAGTESLVASFGTHGTRAGNFTVQNADLILAIGARLDSREAGTPASWFARGAKKIVVDIDAAELGKFDRLGFDVDVRVNADAGAFIQMLLDAVAGVEMPDFTSWHERVADWHLRYPSASPSLAGDDGVNPHQLVETLAAESREGQTFVIDTGCSIAWMMQSFAVKKGQRLIHDFNYTAMGYGLPGAVGASLALGKKEVICVTGDGSLQMNIQELSTIMRHELPVKIILFNNHGHSMVRQTQDQWLGGRHLASSVEGGLGFPDFVAVASAYGFETISIDRAVDVPGGIRRLLEADGPTFCNVEIDPSWAVTPFVVFGRPLEDGEPFLPRHEFMANMIVPPLPISASLPGGR